MTFYSRLRAASIALIGTLLWTAGAQGQAIPGFVNLPANDFVWIWGDREDAIQNRFNDFSVNGSEAGFRCELSVRLHPGSRLSPVEVRQLEQELRQSMAFIQDAANTMYVLEQRREIDWALLDCDKPKPEQLTEAEQQQRVDRALEKARAEQQRRRERQQRNQ